MKNAMNYRHVYMLIIEHAKSEEKLGIRAKGNGDYYERHHILPKSLFPNWKKRKSNLVLLTAREHFFCHQLLTKIYPCQEMFGALSAFIRIRGGTGRILNSYQYTVAREACSKHASLQMRGRTGNKNGFYGRHHSQETRNHISELQKGKSIVERFHGDENKAKAFSNKLSVAMKGSNNPMYHHIWKDSSRRLIGDANRGSKNGFSKQVRNLIDGKIYETMSACCKAYHIKPSKLRELIRTKNRYTTKRGMEVQFEIIK